MLVETDVWTTCVEVIFRVRWFNLWFYLSKVVWFCGPKFNCTMDLGFSGAMVLCYYGSIVTLFSRINMALGFLYSIVPFQNENYIYQYLRN